MLFHSPEKPKKLSLAIIFLCGQEGQQVCSMCYAYAKILMFCSIQSIHEFGRAQHSPEEGGKENERGSVGNGRGRGLLTGLAAEKNTILERKWCVL